jgi:2-methylcitrate dehydratase PrpD
MTTSSGDSPTRALAEFVVGTSYASLPASVIAETKRLILDAVSNAIGGVNTGLGVAAHRYVSTAGGPGHATVIGSAMMTSAPLAAYANARLGDALDASDTFMSVYHIGAPTVLAALSVAEVTGASGRDLLAAVALGMELGARVAASVGPPAVKRRIENGEPPNIRSGRMPASELAATAACARLVGLDVTRFCHALAIAGANAPVNATRWGVLPVLPDQKYQDYGLCGQGAVSAALMAASGMTTHPGILDGDWGLWRLRGAPSSDFPLMTDRLGERWLSLDNTYKPWPSCRWTHHTLTLFERLQQSNELEPEEIERITVRCHPYGVAPYFRNTEPVGMVSCLFNHPHAVAMVALRIPVGPWWYVKSTLNAQTVIDVRRKVEVLPEPAESSIEQWFIDGQVRRLPNSVRVTARGRTFELEGEYARGDSFSPEMRHSESDAATKLLFMGSRLGAADRAWAGRARKISAAISTIDSLPSVKSLLGMLTRDALGISLDESELE